MMSITEKHQGSKMYTFTQSSYYYSNGNNDTTLNLYMYF